MGMNAIYLRHRRKVYVKPGEEQLSDVYLATLQNNLEGLGFVLSQSLMDRLRTESVEKVGRFYKELVADLQTMVGAHRQFRPMYPNFPEQVMQQSSAQLYMNALAHYLTQTLPGYEKAPRPALKDAPPRRVIELGTKEEFDTLFTQLASARTSISPQDKLDVEWFIAQYRDGIARLLPSAIPVKENLAVVAAALLRYTTIADRYLADQVKTATDVLRVAVALSGGDVSLAEPVKFSKFSRRERKMLLAWVERAGNRTEDMLRWKERWKRLGERLHPGDYSTTFPRTYEAFTALRQDQAVATFNSNLERSLEQRDACAALKQLVSRPGDLARRLDHLLRISSDRDEVLAAFRDASNKVSTPVLLQVLTHFQHRGSPARWRTFFPKGDTAKVQAIKNKLPKLSPELCQQVVSVCEAALIERFAKLPPLGKCYIDPALAQYVVPFSQRSASKALRTLVRGSRLPLPQGKVLRFFLWWKNGNGRADIDLSAVAYDAEFKYVSVVTYYNLKTFGAYHSGDIVDAPQGAAEFIDLNIAKTLAMNVRYVVMSVNSFTEQPYCDLPECFAGWMARADANSGKIFEPRTVQDKVDLAANTSICIPAIFDLVAGEVLWADIALRKNPLWYNNIDSNRRGVSLMLEALYAMRKPDLQRLFSLHAQARGEQVETPAAADTIFAVDQGITPFDTSQIISQYL